MASSTSATLQAAHSGATSTGLPPSSSDENFSSRSSVMKSVRASCLSAQSSRTRAAVRTQARRARYADAHARRCADAHPCRAPGSQASQCVSALTAALSLQRARRTRLDARTLWLQATRHDRSNVLQARCRRSNLAADAARLGLRPSSCRPQFRSHPARPMLERQPRPASQLRCIAGLVAALRPDSTT